MLLVSENLAKTDYICYNYNNKVKREIIFKNGCRISGFEETTNVPGSNLLFEDYFANISERDVVTSNEEIARISQSRAKQKIKSIMWLNEWDYFITLTFDPKKHDSKDPDVVLKQIQTWTKKQSERNGIKYMYIFEKHISGAFHIHGVIADPKKALKMSDSGKKQKGNVIYNIDSWASNKGHNTCVPVTKTTTSYSKIASYVGKYVTKDIERVGKQYFYHSNGLILEPQKSYEMPLEVKQEYSSGLSEQWFECEYCYIRETILAE